MKYVQQAFGKVNPERAVRPEIVHFMLYFDNIPSFSRNELFRKYVIKTIVSSAYAKNASISK